MTQQQQARIWQPATATALRLAMVIMGSFLTLTDSSNFKQCLDDPAVARKLAVHGEEKSLVVGTGTWDASIILGRIAQIILNEGVGIETDLNDSFGGSQAVTQGVLGCLDDACANVADWPQIHFDFENWYTEAGHALLEKWPTVVKTGLTGYDGQEGLYMIESIAQRVWNSSRLPLEYYVSLGHPDRPWKQFFTKPSEIFIPEDSGCRGVTADKMAANDMHCSPDGWWYSPACADEPDTCIPVLMGGVGWLGLETCHVIKSNNVPMAVSFLAWPDQRLQEGTVRALFFWWRPDWTFNALGPMRRVIFPKHNRQQWANGIFTTDFPDFWLGKLMWAGLSDLSEEVSMMFDNFEITWSQVNEFMDQMYARHTDGDPDLKFTVACEWVRANEAVWRPWIQVDRTKCLVGQGLLTGGDGESSCQWCPAAAFSDPHPNISHSRICLPCSEGTYQTLPGQSSCEACAAGHFVATTGNTACNRCELGKFAAELGRSECTPCPDGFSTQYPGAMERDMCQCPEGFYRHAVNRMTCEVCPPGMTCGFGSDAFGAASIHVPTSKARALAGALPLVFPAVMLLSRAMAQA